MEIDHDLGKISNSLTTIDPGNNTLIVSGTSGIVVPSGTTLQRPTPVEGAIRRNSTSGYVEIYSNAQWVDIKDYSTAGTIKRLWSNNITSQSGTTVIIPGTTAPLVTAGTQLWTQTITPYSTAVTYLIQTSIAVAASLNNSNLTLALFRNNTYIGGTVQIVASGTNSSTLAFTITDLPATTSPVTYQVRVGTNSGTWYVNRRASENTYGGLKTGWIVWET